jgi:hypothetical protein
MRGDAMARCREDCGECMMARLRTNIKGTKIVASSANGVTFSGEESEIKQMQYTQHRRETVDTR